ncbi:MAG: MFS transporter [Bacteroidaceae bacterium]|nr:MFS transporter [Bacteroidaceae bacterium]
MNVRQRLRILYFLEFGVWGSYLTSLGSYLVSVGMGGRISLFYSVQGFVSLFMPAFMGILADRWIPAQKLLSVSHLIVSIALISMGLYGYQMGGEVSFQTLFLFFAVNMAFFMPTIALTNSVSYNALDRAGLEAVKAFPSIRMFGTIGFILAMIFVDLAGFQRGPQQFLVAGVLSLLLCPYALTMPHCPVNKNKAKKGIVESLGLQAFTLFKQRRMAVFFLFSFLLGAALQVTNGYANPFISSFSDNPEYAGTFGVRHANILISLSQISEALCILLIPFFLKRYGIKIVMLIAMVAWVFRFGFFALGNPGEGVWLFILSMLVYGVAFDFFNISGSLFVDKETDISIRSSAQGLFMLMTNGLGASIGTLSAGLVVNHFVYDMPVEMQLAGWQQAWYVFAGYSFVVAVAFFFLFSYKHQPQQG